jgi:hypothetical protein
MEFLEAVNNCSGHGVMMAGGCVCDDGWTGLADLVFSADNCSYSQDFLKVSSFAFHLACLCLPLPYRPLHTFRGTL